MLCKPRHVSATSLLRTLQCFQCLSHTMPPYFLTFFIRIHLERCALLNLSAFSSLLLSGDLWRRSFSVFGSTVWNSLTLSLRKIEFFNFQKEAKNSSVWKASQLMLASVFFCTCRSAGVCVCEKLFMGMAACMMYILLWNAGFFSP